MSTFQHRVQPVNPGVDAMCAALAGLAVGICLGGDWSRLALLLELVIGH